MSSVITEEIAQRLKNNVERFKHSVKEPISGNWKKMTEAQLWAAVLGQVAVVGGEKSGVQLKAELATDLESWYEKLLSTPSPKRLKEIHKRLRNAGVRYVTVDSQTCKKSRSAVNNFDLLEAYGGARSYFSKIEKIPSEVWRVSIVSDEMSYIRNKGARDLLIGLGLAKNVIALDSRLQTVLKKLGAKLPDDLAANRLRYKAIERELLETVCQPCLITGAHLDRILFNKWKEII